MLNVFNFLCRISSSSVDSGFTSTAHSRANLAELWQARWLVLQLIRRDLTVRYRQTLLGGLWAIINPALNLALYYGVFGLLVRFNPPDYQIPYALVLLSGLVPWMLFSAATNAVGDSLLNNLHLLKKVYFPRIALPLAATGNSLADFLFGLMLLLLLLPLNHVVPHPTRLLLLPFCGLLTVLAAWGLGCLVAVMKLRFRDFRHLMPLVMQALFYATPIVWTPGLLSQRGQALIMANPFSGLIGLYRWILVSGPFPHLPGLIWSVAGGVLLAIVGYSTFVRYEAQVIDRE